MELQRHPTELSCSHPDHTGCRVGCRVRSSVGMEGLEEIIQSASFTLGNCATERPWSSPACGWGTAGTWMPALVGGLKSTCQVKRLCSSSPNSLFSPGGARMEADELGEERTEHSTSNPQAAAG